MRVVFILELVGDLLTGFGGHYKKSFIEIALISRKGSLVEPCSGAVLNGGKWGQEYFFHTPTGTNITSAVYRDQILLGPLQDFWTETFLDVKDPIIMENNAPVHKGVCINAQKIMGCETQPYPHNSLDLNLIENI